MNIIKFHIWTNLWFQGSAKDIWSEVNELKAAASSNRTARQVGILQFRTLLTKSLLAFDIFYLLQLFIAQLHASFMSNYPTRVLHPFSDRLQPSFWALPISSRSHPFFLTSKFFFNKKIHNSKDLNPIIAGWLRQRCERRICLGWRMRGLLQRRRGWTGKRDSSNSKAVWSYKINVWYCITKLMMVVRVNLATKLDTCLMRPSTTHNSNQHFNDSTNFRLDPQGD